MHIPVCTRNRKQRKSDFLLFLLVLLMVSARVLHVLHIFMCKVPLSMCTYLFWLNFSGL